jgi:hypothetical protein
MLFDDSKRTDDTIINPNESTFQFIDRSSWRRCTLVRELLNKWCLPLEHDTEFISQLTSNDNKKHHAAVFELIIQILLNNVGFHAEKHPPGPRKTSPDFKISTKEDFSAYLECTLSGNSFENLEIENRKEAVENIIRSIEYFPYFVNVDFKTISDRSISKKALLNFINTLAPISDSYSDEYLFSIKHPFENNGWKLEIGLMRKSDPTIKISLGMLNAGVKAIDHVRPSLNALNDKKPAKYGISSIPYIIALGNNDMFLKEEEFNELLFGYNAPERINPTYGKGGFYFDRHKPHNTSVSAALFCKNVNLLTLENARFSLWHNPFAKHPVTLNLFPCDEYYYIKDGHILTKKELKKEFDLFSLLDIDKTEYLREPKEPV